MPQRGYYIVQIVGGTGISYGYIKKMYYQRGKYALTPNATLAKHYKTFDEAAADIDILVSYDISIRALVHQMS